MDKINFSSSLNMNFKEGEGQEKGTFEGILVNYNHENKAHGIYKFKKGSLKNAVGKKLHILYNHLNNCIPLGYMVGEDTEDGFIVKGRLDLSKDEDGNIINQDAYKLYSLMKSGSEFDLSVGGYIKKYSITRNENDGVVYAIEEFDAVEGTICLKGAVEGSRIERSFKNEGGEMTGKQNLVMTSKEDLENMFNTFADNKAQTEKMEGIEQTLANQNAKFAELEGTLNNFNEALAGVNEKLNKAESFGEGKEMDFYEEIAMAFSYVNETKAGKTFTSGETVNFSGPSSTTTVPQAVKTKFPTDFVRALQEVNPALALLKFIPITDNSLTIIKEKNMSDRSGFVGETDTRNEREIGGFETIEIPLNQIYGYPAISSKLNGTNFLNVMKHEIRRTLESMGLQIANAIFNGDGVNKPKGILKETGVNEIELDNTDDQTFADSLMLIANKLDDRCTENAAWFMTKDTWTRILTLKDKTGNYLMNNKALVDATERKLVGKKVYIMQTEGSGLKDYTIASATTDPIIVFGDIGLSVTCIANQKVDMAIEDRLTTKGIIKWYLEKCVGGKVVNPEYLIKVTKKS